MKTNEEIKQILQESGVKHIHVRNCSMCDYPLEYIIKNLEKDEIYLDTGCDCVNYKNVEPRSIQDIADWYNMQTSDEVKNNIMKKFGK